MEFLDLGKVKSILSILIWRKHVRNIPYFEFKVEIFLFWGVSLVLHGTRYFLITLLSGAVVIMVLLSCINNFMMGLG